MVPFTKIQEHLRLHCPEALFTLLMRRFMMRISGGWPSGWGAHGLITGESLGQVASQTMEAMAVTGQVCTLPVFRPLVGMDKEEIVRTARKIGTFETSILPYEDSLHRLHPPAPQDPPPNWRRSPRLRPPWTSRPWWRRPSKASKGWCWTREPHRRTHRRGHRAAAGQHRQHRCPDDLPGPVPAGDQRLLHTPWWGDNPQRVRQAVDIARDRADILITTGGLGPTCDDLTKVAVAQAFGKELVYHEPSAQRIRERFAQRGTPVTENNFQQAMVPEGCTVLDNDWGTAPGWPSRPVAPTCSCSPARPGSVR